MRGEGAPVHAGLFGVTLRAQPSNAAIAVHPVINISFVFQASDFLGSAPGYSATIFQSSSEIRTVLNVTLAFAMGCYAGFSPKWTASRRAKCCLREIDPYPRVHPDDASEGRTEGAAVKQWQVWADARSSVCVSAIAGKG
jgi:hypothetical protein